jgi:hypothetical protein
LYARALPSLFTARALVQANLAQDSRWTNASVLPLPESDPNCETTPGASPCIGPFPTGGWFVRGRRVVILEANEDCGADRWH